MNLYFTSEIRDGLDLLGTPMALKTCHGYICNDGVQFQMEIRKISRHRPRFVDTAKLGNFTLLFCRGRQRNVPRIITHVQCFFLFIKPLVLSSSWFDQRSLLCFYRVYINSYLKFTFCQPKQTRSSMLRKKLYNSMSKTRQDSQMLLELNIPCFIELKTMKVVCSLAEIKIL